MHGIQDDRVLALAKIVVGAPDGDLMLAAFRRGPHRLGKPAPDTLKIGKNPIAAFTTNRGKGILKPGLV